MKKLKLNLDEIKVESFDTSNRYSKKGTVNGLADTQQECGYTEYCTVDVETCFSACVTGCYACNPTVTCGCTKQNTVCPPCD